MYSKLGVEDRVVSAADGDVVIRKAGRQFTLEVYPDLPQVSVKKYAEAYRLARGFAKAFEVTVWFANAKGTFVEAVTSEQP